VSNSSFFAGGLKEKCRFARAAWLGFIAYEEKKTPVMPLTGYPFIFTFRMCLKYPA